MRRFSPRCSICVTSPTSSTIPVNIAPLRTTLHVKPAFVEFARTARLMGARRLSLGLQSAKTTSGDVLLRTELLRSGLRMRPERSPFLQAIFTKIFAHALRKAKRAFKRNLRRLGRTGWSEGRPGSLQALVGALKRAVGASCETTRPLI